MKQDAWQSVSVDQLQVGQFVRLGHRWFEHPFLLNRFRIASDKEIAIIRNAQLTQIFVDPVRSAAATNVVPVDPAFDTEDGAISGDIASTVQLQSRKAAFAERVRSQHESLAATRDHYASAVVACRGTFEQLAAGNNGAAAAAGTLVQALVGFATGHGSPLTFASASKPEDAAGLAACRALDAAAIAAAVGRRLGLKPQGLATLTTAALVHAVGIGDLPSTMRDEATIRDPETLLDFRQYPVLGADVLRRCGGFPSEVLQIVRQHRERLDGTGFAEGARGDQIHAYARVIGAIHEFQLFSEREQSTMPATALGHLFRKLRGAYGPVAVDNVIAALTIYPPGTFLTLNDGSIGRVVQVSEQARLRPTVCLFDDTVTPAEAQIIDLADTDALSVARVLDPDQLAGEVREFFGGGWSGITFGHHGVAASQAA